MRIIIVLLFLCSYQLHSQSIDKSIKHGYESIKANDLKKHMSVLTSDSLEGRETTYSGQKKAAEYISSFFRGLNLKPIGDNGTYFQHFDVEVTRVNPNTNIIVDQNGKKKSFVWKTDFIAEAVKDTIVNGQAAFVGFTDTELDATSIEKLRGRIIFVFMGKKSYAKDTSKASILRRLFAVRKDPGITATLIITDSFGPGAYENAIKTIGFLGLDQAKMKLAGSESKYKSNLVKFIISSKIAEEVVKNSGKSLNQIKEEALQDKPFTPIFLDNVNIRIEAMTERQIKQTENVIGLLEGSNTELKTQALAITAHYDHLGKKNGGIIFHGADDNASGTSTVLEIAEAFVQNPIKPKRSVLFIALVGEEKGLLGSQFYVNNPIIPLNQTIADLNIDMVGRMDSTHEAVQDTNYIYAIGSDKISLELDSLLSVSSNEVNQLAVDFKYNGENDPERFYYRSDHYNFAKNNVPVIFFFNGVHFDYHQPSDTIEKILFDKMEKVGKLIYNLAWKLANFDRMLTDKLHQ